MKALLLSTNLDRPEGHLIRGLRQGGVDIKLVISRDSPFQEILKDLDIEIEYWNFKSRIDPSSILYVRSLLRKQKFNLVHTFNARALTAALFASLGANIKQITYRGTTGHLSRLDPSSWIGYLNPKVDKIICVSKAVERYLSEIGLAKEKLEVIYKGHEPDWYEESGMAGDELPHFDADQFYVACSANMRPVKGVDLLLKSLEFIPPDHKIRLILIGEIRDRKISQLLDRSGIKERVDVLGFRRDASRIVARCNAFCMPSREREGLPKALIEAMIQGITPIVTDVGGMPELVQDGAHGLVVPPGNPAAIAEAILKLYNDRAFSKRLGESSRQRISTDFSVRRTIDETLRVYREIVG